MIYKLQNLAKFKNVILYLRVDLKTWLWGGCMRWRFFLFFLHLVSDSVDGRGLWLEWVMDNGNAAAPMRSTRGPPSRRPRAVLDHAPLLFAAVVLELTHTSVL